MSDGEQWKKQTQFNEEMREFMESMNTRFDELRTQVDSIYMICKQSQQQRRTPLRSGVDPASAQKSASKSPDPEIISHARYDTVKIPKLDFPTFDGVGPREWIRKCEQYFIIHSISDDLKLRLGELHLRGEAELWLIRWKRSNPSMSMSWESLKAEVCNRYEVGALLVDEFGQQSPLKLEGSGATHNLFEEMPSLHSMKKNEANDNTEDGVLSFGEMLSVLALKDEEIVNGSAISSFKAWDKEVVPRMEVVWDQNVMWNDADQLFGEMTDSFSVKLDSGIDGYKNVGLSVVNFLRDLGYKDGVTEGLNTSQLMKFTKASCITEFEEVRVNHFNIVNRNILPLIDAGKAFHFNPGWEVEMRHQVIKAHEKIQMQKNLTPSFSSLKNTTIVMVICQNQILEDLLGFLLSRFLTFMFDPGGGRNTSLQLVCGAIGVSNAIKRNSYHKGNSELITHVAVATVKLFNERSYLDWTYTSIRICPTLRDAGLFPSIDSINHDNIVIGSTYLETIVEYLPHGREEEVGALVLTTVCVLKALKSMASFPVETLCNVFKLHAVRLVVQVIFNGESIVPELVKRIVAPLHLGTKWPLATIVLALVIPLVGVWIFENVHMVEVVNAFEGLIKPLWQTLGISLGEIDSFAPCCELTKYGTVAEAIATKEIFPRSKKIIFVMVTTEENFIWDPGQCVISFYILEGKDVFERVGKRIIPMNITWVIMEVIKDVQNNCIIMEWCEMDEYLNISNGYMLQTEQYGEAASFEMVILFQKEQRNQWHAFLQTFASMPSGPLGSWCNYQVDCDNIPCCLKFWSLKNHFTFSWGEFIDDTSRKIITTDNGDPLVTPLDVDTISITGNGVRDSRLLHVAAPFPFEFTRSPIVITVFQCFLTIGSICCATFHLLTHGYTAEIVAESFFDQVGKYR